MLELENRLRDLGIFVLGCNTNLRASDLVRLTVGDVRGKGPGDTVVLREKKTGKIRVIVLNAKVCGVLERWLAVHPDAGDDAAPLFPSHNSGKPLTVPALSRLVKTWCRRAGLEGHYASHSLRKTFGLAHRQAGTHMGVLMRLFNHSREAQTLQYLGVSDEEVQAAYLLEV